MKLEALQEEMKVDSILNHTELDVESVKIPYLHSKWYNYFILESRLFKILDSDLNKLYKNRFEYFLGKCPESVYKEEPLHIRVTRQDVETYILADEAYQALKMKVDLQKMKVDLCQEMIKTINNRNFIIKSTIDFLRFKNGLN